MNKSKLLKYLGGTFLLLIVLAIVGKKMEWFGKPAGTEVSVEKVERRNITQLITANGKIEPETEVKISPDVSGEIVELLVKEGDKVKAGDLLLRIKPDTYLSNLDRMQASVNSAKSNLANSIARHTQTEAQVKQKQADYERNKQLFDQKAISQAEFQTAEANYLVSKAELKASEESINASRFQIVSAEASLKEARENLNKTDIYAPIDGTISRLNIEQGERVVGTAQMAGTEILRIANLQRMQLKVDVNENDILQVSLNDTAVIEIDAYRDQSFKGIVTEIANSAILNNSGADQVTNFEVKILLLPGSYQHIVDKGREYPFRPGMSATADIQTDSKINVLAVPIQAVTTRVDTAQVADPSAKASTPREVVFGALDNKAVQYFVTTGIQDNNYIEILSGITDSLTVITGPYRTLSKTLNDGDLIKISSPEELFKPIE